MWRYFTHAGNYKWLDVLLSLIQAYNKSVHRSIGMAPERVTEAVEHELWQAQEEKGPQKVTAKQPHSKSVVGDHVTLSKAKRVFPKGYLPNWTEEIITVSQVLDTKPAQYKVKDYREEEIQGSFYGPELQKVAKPEQYAIERVIRRRKVRGRTQYFVK